MKKVFILIALLMANMAFAQEAPQTITCPLDNGTPVKIDLKRSFFDSDPSGTVSFFETNGLEFPNANVACTGRFRPGYQGAISCVGLTSFGGIVRVKINQHFVGGDIQNDSYVASVLHETSTNEMNLLAKKSLCTVK
jgi:hypothetical protein